MKKLLIYIFIFTSGHLFSQEYHPLLDTNTVWVVEYDYYNDIPPNTHQIKYHYQKDSIIGDLRYKNFGKGAFGQDVLLREDTTNKKVYILIENFGLIEESLLYDFNAKKGDTLNIFEAGNIYIDSVAYITLYNNEVRKIFYYSGGLMGEYYIEGIGTNLGFIETAEAIGPPALNLMCVKKNNVILWGYRCNEVTQNKINLLKDSQIKVYPNPSKGILNIDELDNCEVYNLMGTLLMTTKDKVVDLKNFESGIYFLNIKDDAGQSFTKKVVLDRK
ncbi:T9SS type A sorting domain-containing protein [Saccharicrinis sp. FJH54]|uniref:T9SS type A sorting domain-containing protein n=1 Tax=Saccharicrinis sp. FJH54 TaxID=3344665 RepID=UPI0035D3FE3E